MASIKVHIYRGENDGAQNCDFRGDRFIGHAQGDEHRTVKEIDPADDQLVAKVLAIGPKINAGFAKGKESTKMLLDELGIDMNSGGIGDLALDLALDGDGVPAFRVGVWDE